MKNKFRFLLTLLIALTVQLSFAQERTITGTVTDDSGPLPGVSILIKGTQKGVETDFDGKFTIQAKTGDVLIFSYVGMATKEVAVPSGNTLNVTLKPDDILEEVIVVAYGTAKKSDYTGAATQINADDLAKRSISNVSTALEGASAGVSATSASGQPGGGQSIRIRGFGSFSGSSAPLYVLDGIPFYGSINTINPNDIESLTILKDAASTSLYGNKAANGVVMITTKKGKNRKGQFTLIASTSIIDRSIPEYDRLGPDKYYELMWEAMRNAEAIPGVDSAADVAAANAFASANVFGELGNNPYNVPNDQIVGTDGKLNPNARLLYADDLDWEDEVTRIGVRQNYDISYQGGTEASDYYVSLGYLDEEGYIKKSDYTRISGRVNVNYQAAKWIKTGLNIAASTSQGNQAQTGTSNSFVNPIRFTRGIGPIYPVYLHDPVTGEYLLDANGEKQYSINDDRPSSASGGRHVIAEIDYNKDLDEITNLNAKSYVDITLTDGLVFTVNASLDQRHWYTSEYENKFVGDGAPNGRANRNYTRTTTVGFNQLLNYTKSFGDHNLKVLAAHESTELKINDLYGARTGLIADGNDELINFVTTTTLQSQTDAETTESYFGRVNYDYNGKYFLSGSFRTDGSSRFHPDARWGEFWSVGGAWRIEKESFMASVNWINLLKLRASYGELGNNRGIGYYPYLGLYDLGYNNQGESGFIQSSLPNPLLSWESSNSYDVALEFGLFNNRINGIFEYYKRESSNLLFNVPLPLSSGVSSITQNVGTMYNKGLEISLSGDIIKTEDFKWNLGINAATIENAFTKLPQEEIINGSKKLMVGRSIYDYWLKEWYGVDPADGAALYVPTQDAIDAGGSDIRTVDGNPVTTNQANAQYHYAGTAIPDLTGSFTTSFEYKAFGLDLLFTYQIGGQTLDYNYQGLMSSGDFGGALHVDALNRWQQPGDVTNIPRMDASQTTNFTATSDRWLIDSDYINLKSINFNYNLPQSLMDKLNVTSIRLFANAENVFNINKLDGMDIQQNFSGTTSNVYTPSRVISFGINVNF
ncbi:TonB-dependent receptor [Flavobacteriaceae bacterium F08102]|nr:TonB-dependent receptor [Flavobacteriaceae bacterium F08102]